MSVVFCSSWSEAAGCQCAFISGASSGLQLCTKTSTGPASRHGLSTCCEIDSAHVRQSWGSPGTPFFIEAVRV